MSNLDLFLYTYANCLKTVVKLYPEEYKYIVNDLDNCIIRMQEAIKRGSYCKEGHAFKLTCKLLRIPYTYKGIKEYINQPTLGEQNDNQ